jgi:hypothetical protein
MSVVLQICLDVLSIAIADFGVTWQDYHGVIW